MVLLFNWLGAKLGLLLVLGSALGGTLSVGAELAVGWLLLLGAALGETV